MAIARIAALVVLIVSAFGQESSSDAIQKYRAELEQNPRNSLAHFLLGELLFDQHDFQSSANEFRAALSGDPHPNGSTLGRISTLAKCSIETTNGNARFMNTNWRRKRMTTQRTPRCSR